MSLCVAVSAPFGLFPPAGCCPLCSLRRSVTFCVCRPAAAVRHGYISPFGLDIHPWGAGPPVFSPLFCPFFMSAAQQRCNMALSRCLGYLLLPWGAAPCALSFVIVLSPLLFPGFMSTAQQRLDIGSFRLWVAPPIYTASVFSAPFGLSLVSPAGCRPSRLALVSFRAALSHCLSA
jgi:hypothetical protein